MHPLSRHQTPGCDGGDPWISAVVALPESKGLAEVMVAGMRNEVLEFPVILAGGEELPTLHPLFLQQNIISSLSWYIPQTKVK